MLGGGEEEKIELPPNSGPFDSADAIVAAHAKVTGTLNLGSNQSEEDLAEGLLRTNNLDMLSVVPSSVFTTCTLITTLHLKRNQIKSLNKAFAALTALESLNLSENSLESLDGAVLASLAGSLTELDVSENQLTALPDEIGTMTKLETLSCFKNQLKELPDSIGQCESLQDANFFNNVLLRLPKGISDCSSLEVLNVGGNKLKTLPDCSKWINMKELKAQHNGLAVLPSFAPMVSLEFLKLDFNKGLSALPEFGDHPELYHFEVGSCKFLADLPPQMPTWKSLKNVNCTSCAIKVIPPCAQPSIEIFNFGGNEVEEVPASFAGCSNMKTFFFQGNNVTSFPDELLALEASITRINLGGQKKEGLAMTPTLEKLKAACTSRKGRFIGL
jgi:Leucine-rich repeat (LRR) protein